MKGRESGMPDEDLWTGFFDPDEVVSRLGCTGRSGDVVEFGCGYGTFTFPVASVLAGTIHALDIDSQMVGWVERAPDMVKACVRPIRLPQSHPLASVSGATNAITFVTKLLGDITIIGPGAGRVETGYAVLSDLLEIHQRMM